MANVANLASAVLNGAVTTSATTITLKGESAMVNGNLIFPTPPFYITVMPARPALGLANATNSEIMQVTAVTTGTNPTFTVTRAQKGTTAKAFVANDVVTLGIYGDDFVKPGQTVNPKFMQTGSGTIGVQNNGSASGFVVVTFPTAFDNVPKVTASLEWSSGEAASVVISSITKTGFQALARSTVSTTTTNAPFHWEAVDVNAPVLV